MSLRVLHVVASWNGSAGSARAALEGLFGALGAVGVSSAVLARDGVGGRLGEGLTPVHDVSETERAVRDADVVHVHGLSDVRLTDGVMGAARVAGRPCVVSPQGALAEDPYDAGWFKRWSARVRLRSVLRRAAVVGALNDAESERLRAVGVTKRVRVLPCGVDLRGVAQRRSCADAGDDGIDDGGGRYVLFLGPIHPVEGLVPLLRSVAELGHDFRGWKLVLAGPEPGEWRRKLEAAIVRKRASDRVTFVTDPDVSAQGMLLARAAVLVAPALRMRCPVSVGQGVAAGVPVVASEHGLPPGAASAVQVCRPDRVELRDALRPLVTCDDAEREAVGRRGREVGAGVFDWSVWVGRYVAAYRGVGGGE